MKIPSLFSGRRHNNRSLILILGSSYLLSSLPSLRPRHGTFSLIGNDGSSSNGYVNVVAAETATRDVPDAGDNYAVADEDDDDDNDDGGLLSLEDLLYLGDEALSKDEFTTAVGYYQDAVTSLKKKTEKKKEEDDSSSSGNDNDDEEPPLVLVVSLYTNLGTALSAKGDNEGAADAYRTALLTHRDRMGAGTTTTTTSSSMNDVDGTTITEEEMTEINGIASQAAFFLGMVYQDLNEIDKSAQSYGFAIKLDPNQWSALSNLGAVLQDELNQPGEALEAYNTAYGLLTNVDAKPTDPPPERRYILSQLQYRMGMCILSSIDGEDNDRKCTLSDDPNRKPVECKQLAANLFSGALEHDPTNEASKHMLAAVTADATLARASNAYVTALFDDYATNFEKSLVKDLKYSGYATLRRAFDDAFGGRENVPTFDRVVDAGCGTGLVGEQFRNVSSYLIGVDLSQAIIDEAIKARPRLYDETIAGDVTDAFRNKKPVSLIVAADSYIYFGDLVPLFQSMEDGLDDEGYAAFTLENVDVDSEKSLGATRPDWRWQLTASGRFAHRKEYVEEVGRKHSLDVVHYQPLQDFRFEGGKGVRGHAFVMKRRRRKEGEEL